MTATPLADLAVEIRAINAGNGWHSMQPHEWPPEGPTQEAVYHLGTVLALVHSEVSEALEAVRRHDKVHFAEEMADVVIRVLDCAGGLDIDMDAEIRAKLDRNRTRGFKHGGKAV
jgi:NTP pyrophosphatase (non-canonical NTP hydrolase)